MCCCFYSLKIRYDFVRLIVNSTIKEIPPLLCFFLLFKKEKKSESLHSCCIKRKWYMQIVCDKHLFELHVVQILQWDNPFWLHFHTIKLIDLCTSLFAHKTWINGLRRVHFYLIFFEFWFNQWNTMKQ